MSKKWVTRGGDNKLDTNAGKQVKEGVFKRFKLFPTFH